MKKRNAFILCATIATLISCEKYTPGNTLEDYSNKYLKISFLKGPYQPINIGRDSNALYPLDSINCTDSFGNNVQLQLYKANLYDYLAPFSFFDYATDKDSAYQKVVKNYTFDFSPRISDSLHYNFTLEIHTTFSGDLDDTYPKTITIIKDQIDTIHKNASIYTPNIVYL